jgi:hypothetical protein
VLQLCQVFMEAMPRFLHAPNGTPVGSQVVHKSFTSGLRLRLILHPARVGHQLEAANPADGAIMGRLTGPGSFSWL